VTLLLSLPVEHRQQITYRHPVLSCAAISSLPQAVPEDRNSSFVYGLCTAAYSNAWEIKHLTNFDKITAIARAM